MALDLKVKVKGFFVRKKGDRKETQEMGKLKFVLYIGERGIGQWKISKSPPNFICENLYWVAFK